MATTEPVRQRYIGKKMPIWEAQELEREWIHTERTEDSLGYRWVNSETKEPVFFTY